MAGAAAGAAACAEQQRTRTCELDTEGGRDEGDADHPGRTRATRGRARRLKTAGRQEIADRLRRAVAPTRTPARTPTTWPPARNRRCSKRGSRGSSSGSTRHTSPSRTSGNGVVDLGERVRLRDLDTGAQLEYELVGSLEADPRQAASRRSPRSDKRSSAAAKAKSLWSTPRGAGSASRSSPSSFRRNRLRWGLAPMDCLASHGQAPGVPVAALRATGEEHGHGDARRRTSHVEVLLRAHPPRQIPTGTSARTCRRCAADCLAIGDLPDVGVAASCDHCGEGGTRWAAERCSDCSACSKPTRPGTSKAETGG